MANWAKIKFYYDTMLGSTGSTLTAQSTAPGYDVKNIYNMLEVNAWKSDTTSTPQYIAYDAGAGNSKTCDYLAIIGHNLSSIGAVVEIQSSNDSFELDVTSVLSPFTPTSDRVILKEFPPSSAKRYYRLRISGTLSASPYMAICVWGNKTELDWATASYDPYGQEAKANINVSQGGYVTGVHTMYIERQMTLTFHDADSALYDKVKTWWETSNLKNFFVAWDTNNNPTDVFLMRPDVKFFNPFKAGGLYRDITLDLTGRKE